jgi:Asp-tRNA(Asn)/Glu-tRNA(Gln) amidotransferase A subunit family amidase
MPSNASPIASLRKQYLQGETSPLEQIELALARANSNAGENVYLELDAAWSRAEARRLRREEIGEKPLWGVPVSLKDCFDLEGFRTSCGSAFYRAKYGVAARDSAVAQRLRRAGAVIIGKTHLHQLAYGITGENRDFGDCIQPRDPARLTGGSSSGAAASVQEGSAMAAIGTDTGGSVRVPAALCGLAGFRSSVTRQDGLWRGGAHLAESFDTVGWLYRDLTDGPMLARALFDLPCVEEAKVAGLRIGVPDATFLHDCEADVRETLRLRCAAFASAGAMVSEFDAHWWGPVFGFFAPIQASEAAALHRGHFTQFEPAIAARLAEGDAIDPESMADLRRLLAEFRVRMSSLFERFDYLLLPCSPMSALAAGADHAETRARILRYTTPISAAGLPVVTLPGSAGGLQLVGRLSGDAELLALSAALKVL